VHQPPAIGPRHLVVVAAILRDLEERDDIRVGERALVDELIADRKTAGHRSFLQFSRVSGDANL
jgi:hypothetical protein